MNNNRPLRAILMKTFYCNGMRFNKGEIYDIAEIRATDGCPVAYLKLWPGAGAIAVMPSTIQILAPECKPNKTNRKRWLKKKKNVS